MLVACFPCRTLSSLGNQFVNNLCGFLGRGGGVANVAVVNLPRVSSTKLFTLADVYNCVHTHHRYWTYISHSRVGIVSLAFQERHMCTLSDCDRNLHQNIHLHTQQYQKQIILLKFSFAWTTKLWNKTTSMFDNNCCATDEEGGKSGVVQTPCCWYFSGMLPWVSLVCWYCCWYCPWLAVSISPVCCPGPRRKLQLARSSSVQMKGAGR